MAIRLNAQVVAETVVEAMNNNRLQLQHPNLFHGCMYFDHHNNCVCAIGAALSKDTARYFDSLPEGTIEALIDGNEVDTDNLEFLAELQGLHDSEAEREHPNEDRFRAGFRQLCARHGVTL